MKIADIFTCPSIRRLQHRLKWQFCTGYWLAGRWCGVGIPLHRRACFGVGWGVGVIPEAAELVKAGLWSL